MRLSNTAHTDRPWRIHQVAPDFRLEDVWELPIAGSREEFPRVVRMITALDPSEASPVVRILFEIRWKLGQLFGWDEPKAGGDSRVPTLRDRLPDDLRTAQPGPYFDALPFNPLYLTDDEFAAEAANSTMHGVMHLSWVPDTDGVFRARMAVLVKPNGRLGMAYMTAIRPFRHLIVYPSLLRQSAKSWRLWRAAEGAAPALRS